MTTVEDRAGFIFDLLQNDNYAKELGQDILPWQEKILGELQDMEQTIESDQPPAFDATLAQMAFFLHSNQDMLGFEWDENVLMGMLKAKWVFITSDRYYYYLQTCDQEEIAILVENSTDISNDSEGFLSDLLNSSEDTFIYYNGEPATINVGFLMWRGEPRF